MNLKGPIAAGVLLFVIVIIVSWMTMPQQEGKVPETAQVLEFKINVENVGIADFDMGSKLHQKAYVNANFIENGSTHGKIRMFWFPKKPMKEVYLVSNYHRDQHQDLMVRSIKKRLENQGIDASHTTLEEAMVMEGKVIIIASDALPKVLADGMVLNLSKKNFVIYSGLPFSVSMDHLGSQFEMGTKIYDLLGIEGNPGNMKIRKTGIKASNLDDYTVVRYEGGGLALFPLPYEKYEETADTVASLVLSQAWQEPLSDKTMLYNKSAGSPVPSGRNTLFSNNAPYTNQSYLRLQYLISSKNKSLRGITDAGPIPYSGQHLAIPPKINSRGSMPYRLEMVQDNDHPVEYEMKLRFMQNGIANKTLEIKNVRIKTISIQEGTLRPELGPGNYVVEAYDQKGQVHARAFTRVPDLDFWLFKIVDNKYYFRVMVDGKPATGKTGMIKINDGVQRKIHIDDEGIAKATYQLENGRYFFELAVDGESSQFVYDHQISSKMDVFYIVIFVGIVFIGIVAVLKRKPAVKWTIRTHPRAEPSSRPLQMGSSTFSKIFRMISEKRGSLALRTTDLRLGFKKYVTKDGKPVFLTESNIYAVLENELRKGRFEEFSGYFVPVDSMEGMPASYWAERRKMADFFTENGIEFSEQKGSDFIFGNGRKKHIAVYPNLNLKKILGKGHEWIILFPSLLQAEEFSKTKKYDPEWMKLALRISHGRIQLMSGEGFRNSEGANAS
jgi:hypothetical protein